MNKKSKNKLKLSEGITLSGALTNNITVVEKLKWGRNSKSYSHFLFHLSDDIEFFMFPLRKHANSWKSKKNIT